MVVVTTIDALGNLDLSCRGCSLDVADAAETLTNDDLAECSWNCLAASALEETVESKRAADNIDAARGKAGEQDHLKKQQLTEEDKEPKRV